MRVADIITEVAETVGKCTDNPVLYTRITRGVELLANKQLVDPLVGTYEFTMDAGYFVALPRDLKTILRVNINKSPSFGRSRLFEFTLNTDGTVDEQENGLAWRDWGYLPIQDEKKLPGALAYKTTNSADNGKTATFWGRDENGREINETLVGDDTAPVAGALEFHKVTRVSREATAYEAFAWCNGTNVIAQYYGDETEPEYRIIKLSVKPASVRVIYRRHVFAVTTLDSFIPMQSASAVIQAAKAADYFAKGDNETAVAALALAEQFMRDEQKSRDEHNDLAAATETPSATDTIIAVADGIRVGDVYDKACEIFGPVGRRKILDHIWQACEILGNRTHWDARIGWVDVYTADNSDEVTYDSAVNSATNGGHGLFVLPRYVETPISINLCKNAQIPRNRWFEYHLNAFGERNLAPCKSWDDCGEVCITRPLPLDGAEEKAVRRVKPTKVVAVPDSDDDDDTVVRVYGHERLADGRDVEVWRGGELGWECPCIAGAYDPAGGAPLFTRIDRITVAEHTGFIKFYTVAETAATTSEIGTVTVVATEQIRFEQAVDSDDPDEPFAAGDTVLVGGVEYEAVSISLFSVGGGVATWFAIFVGPFDADVGDTVALPVSGYFSPVLEIGYWYPDETEPKYRMIRVATKQSKRIRVLYRKRGLKFTSFQEPIPLRSHHAIELMMRAAKVRETDPVAAREYEADARRYLFEDRIKAGPSDTGTLQFDDSVMPGVTGAVH